MQIKGTPEYILEDGKTIGVEKYLVSSTATTGHQDADQREIYNKIVLCPICGQKLTDISYVNGVVILRVKCRRCKNYINVDIVGTK